MSTLNSGGCWPSSLPPVPAVGQDRSGRGQGAPSEEVGASCGCQRPCQGAQPSRDPGSCELDVSMAELGGKLGIGEFVDDTQSDRIALVLGKFRERRTQESTYVRPSDTAERLFCLAVITHGWVTRQPVKGPRQGGFCPPVMRKHVPCHAEEPWNLFIRWQPVDVLPTREQDDERFRREIPRDVGVVSLPPKEPLETRPLLSIQRQECRTRWKLSLKMRGNVHAQLPSPCRKLERLSSRLSTRPDPRMEGRVVTSRSHLACRG